MEEVTSSTNSSQIDAAPEKDQTGVIVGTAVGVPVIIIAVVILILYQRRLRNSNPKMETDESVKQRDRTIQPNESGIRWLKFRLASDTYLTQEYEDLDMELKASGKSRSTRQSETFREVYTHKGTTYILTNIMFTESVTNMLQFIWKEMISFVIMLTPEEELQDIEQYWPKSQEEIDCGNELKFRTTTETTDMGNYKYTVMKAFLGKMEREVHHYRFVWPRERSTFPDALLQFAQNLRAEVSRHPNPGPVLVHCSRDFQWTSAYLVTDMFLHASQSPFNVYATVLDLATRCPQVFCDKERYVFMHQCLKIALEAEKSKRDSTNGLYTDPHMSDIDGFSENTIAEIDRAYERFNQQSAANSNVYCQIYDVPKSAEVEMRRPFTPQEVTQVHSTGNRCLSHPQRDVQTKHISVIQELGRVLPAHQGRTPVSHVQEEPIYAEMKPEVRRAHDKIRFGLRK